MEKPFTFKLKLSLEEMSLRKVVVSLWSETNVLSSIAESRFDSLPEYQRSSEYHIIVNKVKQKVSKLVVPESLKKRMMDIVKSIGSELLGWKKIHENILNSCGEVIGTEIMKQLCWNSAGSVDYEATAEKLLRLEVLEVDLRYKLAASYYLIDYIPALWEQLPEVLKHYYLSHVASWKEKVGMEFYWAHILKKEKSGPEDDFEKYLHQTRFHSYCITRSAIKGNKVATEYFFKRLTSEDRNYYTPSMIFSVVIESIKIPFPGEFPRGKLPRVLCYLLSMMRYEEQMAALMKYPCDILASFMDWPWQDLFLDIAGRIWAFLPESNFEYLLCKIHQYIEISGYYLPNSLQKFFLECPSAFKNHFINDSKMLVHFFSVFFRVEDTETIKVIFRSASIEDRMRMVSSKGFFELFDTHIMTDRWRVVKVCLDEATASEEDKDRLKKTYMEFLTRLERPDVCLRKRRWEEIFDVIDKISKDNTSTRSAEETNNVPVKKMKKETDCLLLH